MVTQCHQCHRRSTVECSQIALKDLRGEKKKGPVTASFNMKSGLKMQTAGGLLARNVGILLSLKALRHHETMGDQYYICYLNLACNAINI